MTIGMYIIIGLVAFFAIVGFLFTIVCIVALLSDDGSSRPYVLNSSTDTGWTFRNNPYDMEGLELAPQVHRAIKSKEDTIMANKVKKLESEVENLIDVVEDEDKLRKLHAETEENNRHKEAIKIIKGGTD